MATRQILAGGVAIGGGAPVTVQSMTTTHTRDVEATLAQIKNLVDHGCQIVRMAMENGQDAAAVRTLVDATTVPLVADIHFDVRLALTALENGIHKLRINPGNIGGEAKVALLADALKAHPVPVRIGVNSGSIEKELLRKYGGPTPKAMVESALSHARMLEKRGFYDMALSMKGTSVRDTIAAYRLAREACDYPLHVGFTHMGLPEDGMIPTAIGVGSLLLEGIGDTIRVSLTGDPAREVDLGIQILRAVGLRSQGVTVLSCPTCGRCHVDVEHMAKTVRAATRGIDAPVTVAVMGCVVNGPGEAKQADLGIAGGKTGWALFQGEEVLSLKDGQAIPELLNRIEALAAQRKGM